MRMSDWSSDVGSSDLIADFEAKRAEQKQLGQLIPQASAAEKQALLAQTKTLAAQVKEAEAAQAAAEEAWPSALLHIRSEERRVGQACVSKCGSRRPRDHSQQNNNINCTKHLTL